MLQSFIKSRLEFYIYYHILVRYHAKSRTEKKRIKGIVNKLFRLNYLNIADLYVTRNELVYYEFTAFQLICLFPVWIKLYAGYCSDPYHFNIKNVHELNRIQGLDRLQEQCKTIFIAALLNPGDFLVLKSLINQLQKLVTIETDGTQDEAKELINKYEDCMAELNQKSVSYESIVHRRENTEAVEEANNFIGSLSRRDNPISKPNNVAMLYELEQDKSLQSLLAHELLYKLD
eukprot:NODE_672_length_5352_cov_0.334856.p2 type:complete len:232 gc:universal NODE_672_length_5352_cov_0.334856:2215-1520(-)